MLLRQAAHSTPRRNSASAWKRGNNRCCRHGSPNRPPLGVAAAPLFNRRKIVLGRSALRTDPIVGNRFKGCSGRDSPVRIARRGVVHIAAHVTYIFLHWYMPSHGSMHQTGRRSPVGHLLFDVTAKLRPSSCRACCSSPRPLRHPTLPSGAKPRRDCRHPPTARCGR